MKKGFWMAHPDTELPFLKGSHEIEDKLRAYRELSAYTINAVEKAIQEITEEIKNNSSLKNLFMSRKLELEKTLKIIKHDTKRI